MAVFKTPAFLENHGPDELQALGIKIMPDDIDMSSGGHPWNYTRSAALMAAEICEYIIPEAIRVFVPGYSYGTYLDDHARSRAMSRRAATAANGTLTITGDANSVIPAGSTFSTSSINGEPSVDYKTTEEIKIPSSGTVSVYVECAQTGTIGNTAAATVIHVGSKINGIKSVTNEEAITGGTEEESDESLIERIENYDRTLGNTYGGSPSDYKHWAESVNGVGKASVIPAQDDTGLVTIVLTDANGDPATETLREAVYDHIMSPNDQYARLAPTGAILSVVSPTTVKLAVQATVSLSGDATIESVRSNFLKNLQAYLPEALVDKEIRYSRITRELSNSAGVYDYSDVKIGVNDGGSVTYGEKNIEVSQVHLPSVAESDIHLTVKT